MNQLRITVRIDFDRHNAIGPGKIALLEQLRQCGSLSQAARALDMSYRRAWQLLSSLNQSFREPLVVTAIGGSGGGGSTLTPLGKAMIEAYREFERTVNRQADRQFGRFMRTVNPTSSSARRPIARSAARTPVRKNRARTSVR